MSRRKSMGRRHSRRDFSHKAMNIHPKNVSQAGPMRGGIRL